LVGRVEVLLAQELTGARGESSGMFLRVTVSRKGRAKWRGERGNRQWVGALEGALTRHAASPSAYGHQVVGAA
jgi:hypothetical protein